MQTGKEKWNKRYEGWQAAVFFLHTTNSNTTTAAVNHENASETTHPYSFVRPCWMKRVRLASWATMAIAQHVPMAFLSL